MHGWLAAVARAQGGCWPGFLAAPSIFWVNDSDAMLVADTIVGMALAFAVAIGVTNAGVMIALWMIQFSLYSVGQIFWGYGWEMQLLETGHARRDRVPADDAGGRSLVMRRRRRASGSFGGSSRA